MNITRNIVRNIVNMRDFVRNVSGAAVIEFALILPVLLLLLVGGVEITRYVLVHQKVDKVASQMSDFISQLPQPKTIDAASLQQAFGTLMEPFGTEGSQFTFSTIERETEDGDMEITYQSPDGAASKLGSVGSIISQDDLRGIILNAGDRLIAVEVNHSHSNILGGLLSDLGLVDNPTDNEGSEIYKSAFYRYRLDVEFDIPSPEAQDLGELPLSCGYFRDADSDDKNKLYGPENSKISFLKDGNYDKWPIDDPDLVDTPHPCKCYKENVKISRSLTKFLSSCRPELTAEDGPYECPEWGKYNNTNVTYNKKNFVLRCCSSASSEEIKCNGCVTATDTFQEPEDPSDEECQPKKKPQNPKPKPKPKPNQKPKPKPQPKPKPKPQPKPKPVTGF